MSIYLSENFGRRSFRAALDSHEDFDCGAALRAECKIPSRMKFRWKMGSTKPGHLVWTDGHSILLSEELKSCLVPCSGWSSVPVTLLLQTLEPAGRYHLLSITGRCGNFIASKTTRLPAGPDRAWDMYRGLCFDSGPAQTDFSMPTERMFHIFVSENAASTIGDLCDSVGLVPC